MSARFWLYFLLFNILLVLPSCEPTVKKANFKNEVDPTEKIKNQIVRVNQLELQKESDEMDAYERSHQLSFIKTTSGIRYLVYKHSLSGDSLRDNMEIEIDYEVKLLDGTLCYSSKIEGIKKLIIGAEEAESGLHKGLLYLKRGDKALLLIPSVLAHGLLGDFKKIPPQMPIVFQVSVH
jgi:FKBP-type peptidyl-prolyl cis-trans isomerase